MVGFRNLHVDMEIAYSAGGTTESKKKKKKNWIVAFKDHDIIGIHPYYIQGIPYTIDIHLHFGSNLDLSLSFNWETLFE